MSDSDRSLRRLLDSNLVGIVSTAASTGEIEDANNAFLRLLGYERDALHTLTLDDLTPPEVRHVDAAALAEARMFGAVRPWEKVFVRKDGTRVDVLVGVDFQPPDSCLYLVLDITDRRRLEEQFRRAQKMEAVGRFAGGIAHDFNNLLCVIIGYVDLLLHRLGDGDPLGRDAMEALRAADKAAGLVRQLLVFSRKQASQPTPANLSTIVHGLEPLVRRLVGEKIDLVVRLDPHLPVVWADPSQMEQVLMNLAVNARDAMPQGGTLTIETADAGRVERRLAPRSPPGQPRRHVRLRIVDTGCGMDKETLGHVFEPFFTTKGPERGTGLGLATVHGIVSQIGGLIHVESELGKGTSFEILLPVAAAVLAPQVEADTLLRPHPRGTETVLIVEDDDLLRDVLGATLEEHGYAVLVASDGDQALEACRARDGAIDVMITDVVLPRMSGTALYRTVHARYPRIRAIYMSGHVEEEFITSTDGAFLPKPFGPGTLLEKIRAVVES